MALCFDNMKYGHNETMKSRVKGMRASVVPRGRTYFWVDFPGTVCLANFRCRFATLSNRGRDAGWDGKRWVGRRAFPTLSGQEVGKWRSFSHFETALAHLFPPFSTQVVDFPRIEHVRLFWEGHEIGFSHGWTTMDTDKRLN
jgi:hypothetical protein